MGLDVDLFVSDKDGLSEFVCSICLDVSRPPVVFPCEAEHVFCADCVRNVKECPSDRQPRGKNAPTPLKGAFLRTYNNLKLKCPNECDGWTGFIGDLDSHLSSWCRLSVAVCPHEGCGLKTTREDMDTHVRICDYRIVACPHCEDIMIQASLADHVSSICLSALVECPSGGASCPRLPRNQVNQHVAMDHAEVPCSWADFGCTHRCPRGQLEAHETDNRALAQHMRLVQGPLRSLRNAAALLPQGHTLDDMLSDMVQTYTSARRNESVSSPSNKTTTFSVTTPPLNNNTNNSKNADNNAPSSVATVTTPPLSDASSSSSCSVRIIKSLRDISELKSISHVPTQFIFDKEGELTEAHVISLVQHCSQLQHVKISRCYKLTDASIIPLTQHCSHLQHVNLSGCRNLTDASIISLAQHCPQLQHVRISLCSNLTDASIICLAQHCPQLQHVNLSRY
eukprot:TRINITY_DN4671_c0_g2_i2.p1 TRINITY_DN4671_c0_g2~~TRINITY_DN4671_c0_g2_i2.p1  ORF type:complete len:464 (+),score=55.75 TRINITY_DN4671_c0_g2_i2:35-1393(+)